MSRLFAALLLVACSDPYEGREKTTRPSVDSGAPEGPPVDTHDSGGNDSEQAESVPLDSDGDGWPDDEDCVPDDPTIYPGADDEWYDGIDSDCAGNSDYDQDYDGYLASGIGGNDCNDLDATIYPGADDEWYDGIDSDCAFDDDYDADKDGDRDPSGGGEDCDDTDPTISSLAVEILGDAIDSDCDGDPDSFRFTPLDMSRATALRGPRIAVDSTWAMVGFLADSYFDSSTGTNLESVGMQFYFDALDPAGGSLALGAFYWGSSYTLQEGFDFWASDDHQVWAYGLQSRGTRYLVADVYRASDASWMATGWGFPTTDAFDDVEISEQADGSLHLVGCDDQGGLLTWMHATPDGFYGDTGVSGDDESGVPSDACVVQPEEVRILVGNHDDPSFEVYSYSGSFGLQSEGTELGYTAYDLDRAKKASHEAFVVAQGAGGVHLELDGSVAELNGGEATAVEVELDGSGNAYVAYASGAATAWFAWGTAGLSMPEVELDPGLGGVEEIDVAMTGSGLLLLVARFGDEAAWAVVDPG